MKPQFAEAVVNHWAALYTRGLTTSVAADRREELSADIRDQVSWSAEMGVPQGVIARSVMWRALKGVPSDLLWRRAQRRSALSSEDRFRAQLMPAGTLGALLMLIAGVVSTSRGLHIGSEFWASWVNAPAVKPVIVATMAAACGFVMLMRSRTRFVGALWTLGASQVLVLQGLPLLASTSSMLRWASTVEPTVIIALLAIDVGVGSYYLAVAIAWAPIRARA